MKEEILSNLSNPIQLEKLYRSDKSTFKRAFATLSPEFKDNALVNFWNARLNYTREDFSWSVGPEFVFLAIAALIAGFVAKLPAIFYIDDEFFYPRNLGFILFPVLTAFFAWKNNLPTVKVVFIAVITIIGVSFINALPGATTSDTVILSCIHMLVVLWSVLGFAFESDKNNTVENRLTYLKYNGDLVVITTLIVITGGIVTGITIGLFHLIGLDIEQFYFQNVVIFGLPIAPILGTYLIQTNPQLVGKISPVIAKIFSPVVLVMLIVYLVAIIYSGKNPYNNREFLLMFNALLVGVMAIIFFSIAGTSQTGKNSIESWVLLLLSCFTIIVNIIALSAILFRISEGGFTANRAAVLGGNVVILANLLLVTVQLFRVVTKKAETSAVGNTIARFLPVYFVWAAIVTFLFLFIFGTK